MATNEAAAQQPRISRRTGKPVRNKSDVGTARRRQIAENATRAYRFNAARERIQRIVDAWPPLTAEQREQLALLLHPGGPRE